MIHRRRAVATLLEDRPSSLLAVAGLGSAAWDLAASGDDPRDFHFIGAMGQATPFALGLALARPTQRVVLFTGDGEMLMGVGALTTVASCAPNNLAVVVLDNRVYHETGGQPTATAGPTDLAAVARACGIRDSKRIADAAELPALRRAIASEPGPIFANVEVLAEPLPLVFPPSFEGAVAIDRFRGAVLEDPETGTRR